MWDSDYTEQNPYDRLFNSVGIQVINRGAFHAYAGIDNSGDITGGDFSVGLQMTANSVDWYLPTAYHISGYVQNSGDVALGDNSTGIFLAGHERRCGEIPGQSPLVDSDLSGYSMRPGPASFHLRYYWSRHSPLHELFWYGH